MEKEFVTVEIAKELQKLGFNDPCICGFDSEGRLRTKLATTNGMGCTISWDKFDDQLPAPLWQQALEFFESLGIRFVLDWTYYDGFHYHHRWTFPNGDYFLSETDYNSTFENRKYLIINIINKIKEREK